MTTSHETTKRHRAQLEADGDILPPAVLGAGVEIEDDVLVAWCAPREGRVATLYLSWHPEPDLLELAR